MGIEWRATFGSRGSARRIDVQVGGDPSKDTLLPDVRARAAGELCRRNLRSARTATAACG